MIINNFNFEFYAFLEFFWIVILWPKSPFFRIFSWKVDARVIIIAVMQKFGEKSVYFGWFIVYGF